MKRIYTSLAPIILVFAIILISSHFAKAENAITIQAEKGLAEAQSLLNSIGDVSDVELSEINSKIENIVSDNQSNDSTEGESQEYELFEISASSYAKIQTMAAIEHFMKAIQFMNPLEITKGYNCLATARLALEKGRAYTVSGGMLDDDAKILALMTGSDKELVNKLNDLIDKLNKEGSGSLDELMTEFYSLKDSMASKAKGVLDGASDMPSGFEKTIDLFKNQFKEKVVDQIIPAPIQNVFSGFWEGVKPTYESPWADLETALDPVVLYSGEFKLEETDLRVKSVGMDFEFKRIYRNKWERKSVMGYNWIFNYGERLLIHDNSVMYRSESGQVYGFKKQQDGSFQSPYQLFSILKKRGENYELKDRVGKVKSFDKKGRLISVKDRFGNEMTFEYGKGGLLQVIKDTLGREYKLGYYQGKLTNLKDPFGREVKYSYSDAGDLESVRSPVTRMFPEGKVARYNYSGGYPEESLNHNLTMIMDPKGQVYLENRYGEEGFEKDRVIAQRFGGEGAPLMKVTYELVRKDGGMNTVTSRTTVTDRLGVKKVYEHNKYGLRLSGDGYKYSYNEDGQVVSETSPGGRVRQYIYDSDSKNRTAQRNVIKEVIKGKDGATIEKSFLYGPYGQVKLRKVGLGEETLKIEYKLDKLGNVVGKISGGVETKYEYNDKGQRIRSERLNKITEYKYEGANLVSVTEKAGEESRVRKMEYDEKGYLTGRTDPLGNKTRFWVNAMGQIIQKQDPLGVKSFYKYDLNNNLVEMSIENKGNLNRKEIGDLLTKQFEYDVYDNLIKKRQTVDKDTWQEEQYEYDAEERLKAVITPDGTKRTFEYNDKGWLISETENGIRKYTRKYDLDGALIEVNSPAKGLRSWKRDGLGRVVSYKNPNGATMKVAYNSYGVIKEHKTFGTSGFSNKFENAWFCDMTDSLLAAKRYKYNDLGNIVEEASLDTKNDEWLVLQRKYENDRPVEVSDAEGVMAKYVYDGFGDLAEMEYAGGNKVSLKYDPKGKLVERKVSNGDHEVVQKYEYDALGRKITSLGEAPTGVLRYYNSIGSVVESIDGVGKKTTNTYDGVGRLLEQKSPGRVRKFRWDRKGRLTKLIDGDGQETKFTYDDQNRVKTKMSSDGIVTEYIFNDLGQVKEKREGGSTYIYEYSPSGKIISRKSNGYEQRYTYDELGRLTSTYDSNDPANIADDVSAKFVYNSFNQLISEALNDKVVRYEYNGRGKNTHVYYPSGSVKENVFNNAGFISSISMDGEELVKYDYALFEIKAEESYPNGLQKEFKYNDEMQLVGESLKSSNAKTELQSYQYKYDPMGRLVEAQNLREQKWMGYEYDELNRLSKVTSATGSASKQNDTNIATYEFTPEGDWKSFANSVGEEKFLVSDGHKYSKVGDSNLSYDKRGNLISDGAQEYKYDPWNRIILVRKDGQEIAKYTYDASNRRVSKKIANDQIAYVYSVWNVIEEYKNGDLVRQYAFGRNIDSAVGFRKDQSNYTYHSDRQGNVLAVSDTTGTIKERYKYGEYGKLNVYDSQGNELSKSKLSNPITYTGQRYDDETGLYYYKNRYYSSELGRFLTKDPLSMIDGPNLYAYVDNDPMNWIDPMGTQKQYSYYAVEESGNVVMNGLQQWYGDWKTGWEYIIDETGEWGGRQYEDWKIGWDYLLPKIDANVQYMTGVIDEISPLTPMFQWINKQVYGEETPSSLYEDSYWDGRAFKEDLAAFDERAVAWVEEKGYGLDYAYYALSGLVKLAEDVDEIAKHPLQTAENVIEGAWTVTSGSAQMFAYCTVSGITFGTVLEDRCNSSLQTSDQIIDAIVISVKECVSDKRCATEFTTQIIADALSGKLLLKTKEIKRLTNAIEELDDIHDKVKYLDNIESIEDRAKVLNSMYDPYYAGQILKNADNPISLLKEMNPGDSAKILNGMHDPKTASNILKQMDADDAAPILSKMNSKESAEILGKMDDINQAADLLKKVDNPSEIILSLDKKQSVNILNKVDLNDAAKMLKGLNDPEKAATILKEMDDPFNEVKDQFLKDNKDIISKKIENAIAIKDDVKEKLLDVTETNKVKLDWDETKVIKGEKRIADKAVMDYGGDVSQVKDILRTRIEISYDDAVSGDYKKIIDDLEAQFGEPVRPIKDSLLTPNEKTGYRNVLANYEMNGEVFEVQIVVKEIIEANEVTHSFIEATRKFDPIKQGTPGTKIELPAEVENLKTQLNEEAKKINDAAWEKAANG